MNGRALALALAGTWGAVGATACTRPPHVTSPYAVSSASCDAAPDSWLGAFEADLDSLRRAARIPGLSVAVVKDGELALARGFGFADLEARVPATADTPYDIASVSKPLAGVVAMRLVELGLLDLDRELRTYDGFQEFCDEVRREGGLFFADYRCDTEPLTLRNALTMTANGRAGERFFYNPISFSWASRPMMQVTGRSYSELVAEHVFAPAGTTRSARVHRGLPLRADLAAELARPYDVDSLGNASRSPGPPPQGDGAAGGAISTARDLARIDIALEAGLLITSGSRAVIWEPARAPSGARLPYALGWYVQEIDGHRLLWHSGLWEGAYSALYLKVPAERLTLILLANSDGLWWDNPLDRAAVEESPFARAFLRRLVRRSRGAL